ncbi:MAG: thiamine pyrophosphate-dependent enzyme, partial [archaeon]|nr:thiamine pyrophosphate-dependent enzyme [archaeon]
GSDPGEGQNCCPVSIPVGSQPLHAVGCALGMKYKKRDAVAVGYMGDGGTSEGEFHEAMNAAGVFNAPVILICQNNQYAISVARKNQTAAQTLAQKAIAYGIEGLQVDGNDVLACYLATSIAREKAISGKGPTFLEFETYRIGDHTTADDSTRYRTKEEIAAWRAKDPIARFETFLLAKGILSPSLIDQIKQEAVAKVEKAVQAYETMPPQKIEDLFDHMYAITPKDLAEQKRAYVGFRQTHGKENQPDTIGPGFP